MNSFYDEIQSTSDADPYYSGYDMMVPIGDTLQSIDDNKDIPDSQLDEVSQCYYSGSIERSREFLMTMIEYTVEDIIDSIRIGEPVSIRITMRKVVLNVSKKRKTMDSVYDSTQPDKENTHQNTRILSLAGGMTARSLARYLCVLQIIYEAIAYKIIVTKRDIFYRDVVLFRTQNVVDMTAASKGLIFGPVRLKLKNNKVLDCLSDSSTDSNNEQGTLIPPINLICDIQCKAKYVIVIEKEATFRHLASSGFCQSLPESCILITGKGYPDLATRQLIKYFSIHYKSIPILALMDNDPHGLDIYATYKWGAKAFAYDVFNLAVQSIELIGLTCQDRNEYMI
ncbi:Spo11/DNA topoisomerase VI subunit A [Pilobolus umbonatus]|nr:Spo11/DNA topoisomerase VI subunit A [Pilobolus umbonatus]